MLLLPTLLRCSAYKDIQWMQRPGLYMLLVLASCCSFHTCMQQLKHKKLVENKDSFTVLVLYDLALADT